MIEDSVISKLTKLPFLFDKIGRVVIHDDRVFRIISNKKYVEIYKKIINSPDFDTLFDIGLIKTSIYKEGPNDSFLILEHSKLNFILHPSEYTNQMFWDAAFMYVKLCKTLFDKYQILMVDAHPWNITFQGPKAVFYDFSSLYRGDTIPKGWVDEFEKYFSIPIKLASLSKLSYPLSQQYRKEHLEGFGLMVMQNKLLLKGFNLKFKSLTKLKSNPSIYYDGLLKWLERNKPISPSKQYWSKYEQSHFAEIETPRTIKQRFVYQMLTNQRPKTVLDLASNKGFYAMMAEKLGAKVMAFDYEEETINNCRKIAQELNSKITMGVVNFNTPTPASGIGLTIANAYDRFKSDIVLSLGLIHHICLTQKIPVSVFCGICMEYANAGIILEFVYPDDVHVSKWKVSIPDDYNIESISSYFETKFPIVTKSDSIEHDGVHRLIVFFSRL